MGTTTYSGPVRSENGFQSVTKNAATGVITVDATFGSNFFQLTPILTAALPVAAASNQGQVRLISDNGAGDDEYALVISTGSAWVTAVGAALS